MSYSIKILGHLKSRYRDTQLQVTENICDLKNLSPKIYHYFEILNITLNMTLYKDGPRTEIIKIFPMNVDP